MRITLLSTTACIPVLVGALLWAPAAIAQPTGNPKGSAAPASADSAKSPAGGGVSGSAGATDTGKLTTDKGGAEARLHTNRSPGTGTAGGLPKKTPGDGAPLGGSKPGPNNKPDPQ